MSTDEKPYVVVSVLDPAIDTEAMTSDAMVQYIAARDIKHLKWRGGMQPTRYHLREIRHSVWESYVMATDSEAERHLRAFLCAVVKVENLRQRDGSILPAYEPAGVPRNAYAPESEAERFAPRVRAEIGAVAFLRSFLGWGTEPVYRLPPTLVPYLAARTYLPAVATPLEPAPSSSEASRAPEASLATSDATAPAASISAAGSASPTAVTATGPLMEVA